MNKEVEVVSGRIKQLCGEEQKRKLVQQSYESGLSLNQFAKQCGISPASLCQWRKRFPIEGAQQAQSHDDMEALRAENASLKKELFKIKAYLGHKIFEFEGIQIT